MTQTPFLKYMVYKLYPFSLAKKTLFCPQPLQQLLSPAENDATLLDATWYVCLHTLLHVVTRYCAKFETGQTFDPTFLLFRDFRSVAQQCWIRLHSSSNIVGGRYTRSLRIASIVLWVVSFLRCTAGPNIVGSCFIRLYTTANTDATTSNNVGSCCVGLHVALRLEPI